MNTSVKLLLQKYGFKSFFPTDSVPSEIVNSNCKKLYADIVKENNFLSTKIKIVLNDCREKVIYETAFGTSREKELPAAYNQALREAGKSFDKLDYKYNNNFEVEILDIPGTKPGMIAPDPPPPPKKESVATDLVYGEAHSGSEIFYFAQPTANGYQVVDSEPKVIMKLYKTSQKDVFMAVKGDINGTVISKNEQWFFEYYKDGKLVSELLNLKF